MTILGAMKDPNIFGKGFNAPSWRPWLSFLAALFALPMDAEALALYRHHTGRTAPSARPARYAQLVVGRRGGKSRILALIAAYLGCVPDHTPHVVPGETPVIAIIAADRKQARVILSYIVGLLRSSPLLAQMIQDELAESVRLTNGVVVEVHTASIGAPRGRTFLGVFADETAFWPVGDSANPDVEVINAVRPGLSTIPYSLLLVASSPYAKRGILYSNYAKHFGRDDAPVLVWQGTTQEMNASLVDDPLIAEMYEEDPERAAAEFGAQFRSDIVAFITREAIEDVVPRGMRELPPGGGITYTGFVDPSGGSADSMTLAIGHMEADGIAVLDCIRETRPPFSPDAVVEEYATTLKAYGIARVTGDAYAGEWPRERFAARGIAYHVSKKPKSGIYNEFLPALNGRRVRLLDIPRLIGQLVTLERRTARGGRDSIDHTPGAHDDVANVACGALVQVLEDRRPALIRQSDLADERPAEHAAPQMIFSTAWAGLDGTIAHVIFSYCDHVMPQLVVMNFDHAPWSGSALPEIAQRLDDMCEAAMERRPVLKETGVHAVMHVPTQLQRSAIDAMRRAFDQRLDRADARRRIIEVQSVGAELLADPISLILNASTSVAAGRIKLGPAAVDRAREKPLFGVLELRPGETVDTNPLRVALLVGMAQIDEAPQPMVGASVPFG